MHRAELIELQSSGDDIADAAMAVRGLTVSYGNSPVVFSVDATMPKGTMTAIIGPNGAGKSTLLKGILGIVQPLAGKVSLFGAPVSDQRDRVAYVPQRATIDWDFPTRVFDVVAMGLSRELGLLGRLRQDHRDRIDSCLDRVGMRNFADRQIGRLSGGQQQRVFLARALAQDADLFLLDEPLAGVDAATEKSIVAVLDNLKSEGKTVVAVHHDLSTVREYFDRVLILNVRALAEGPVESAFTSTALQSAYGGRLAATQVDGLGQAEL